MPTLWTIETEDGDFLGEQHAITPKVAFIRNLRGAETPSLAELQLEQIGTGEYRLLYGKTKYVLTANESARRSG